MFKVNSFILGLILALISSVAMSAEKEEFSSSQIKQLKNGIFEVVTLKLEDNVVYKEEFPKDLIPFHVRNDKYHSLGTAFLIEDNTFVSAAHVFNLEYHSLLSKNYAVRDADGNIFKITNVEKYSNYRDLIQFKVEGNTEKYHKFTLADNYSAGDVVYAAGNAHGEGVIFRKGSLTSFTYEPIDGKWKNIRYSAAASPGNSGGPLLNLSGEVVGIVTQKSSNENLNYAFPIKEFVAFTDKSAEFFNNQMAEVEALQRLRYSWKFSAKLPQNILELRKLAEQSFYKRFEDGRDEFEAKYGKDVFPNHKNVMNYLKNQSNKDMFGIIDMNGNGEWSLFRPDEESSIKITNDQTLYFHGNDKIMGSYQFVLEKPKNKKLKDFIEDKKGILDTFLTSVQWNRKVAETPIYISSYGAPVHEEQVTDNYGRNWQMATWNDQYSDRAIMIYCLAIPKGVACDLVETSVAWLEVQKGGYKDNLHRMMLSYAAKLDEWQEFIELPDSVIPKSFKGSVLEVANNEIEFKLGEFTGKLKDLKLTGDSRLHIAMEINPENVNELVVGSLNLTPNENESGTFYVSKYYNIGSEASDSYKDFWHKFTTLKSPYNFEVIDEGEVNSKYMNLGASGKFKNLTGDTAEQVGYLVGCKLQSEVKVEELNKSCDSFVNGLH